jgi:hypothetical protein
MKTPEKTLINIIRKIPPLPPLKQEEKLFASYFCCFLLLPMRILKSLIPRILFCFSYFLLFSSYFIFLLVFSFIFLVFCFLSRIFFYFSRILFSFSSVFRLFLSSLKFLSRAPKAQNPAYLSLDILLLIFPLSPFCTLSLFFFLDNVVLCNFNNESFRLSRGRKRERRLTCMLIQVRTKRISIPPFIIQLVIKI